MSIDAMYKALNLLKGAKLCGIYNIGNLDEKETYIDKAIAELRQAIENEDKRMPVAYCVDCWGDQKYFGTVSQANDYVEYLSSGSLTAEVYPLYTTPPA